MANNNLLIGIGLIIVGFVLIGIDALQLGLDIPLDSLTFIIFVAAILALGVPLL